MNEQLTLDQDTKRKTEKEFQQSHADIFTADTPSKREAAIKRNDDSRTALILIYGYGLEDLARLIDEANA